MGWLFGWRTKEAMVKHLVAPDGSNCEILDHAVVGNTLYMLCRHKEAEAGTPNPKFIAVILMQYARGCGGWSKADNGANDWGYKDMDESSGPYVFTCPKRILDASECDRPTAVEWRQHCREWQAEQKARTKFFAGLKPGDVFYAGGQRLIYADKLSKRASRTYVAGYTERGQLFKWRKRNVTQHPPKEAQDGHA